MEERLQKILARAGFGSRRACEELIRQRRVTVNGQVAQIGQKANSDHDRITLDGNLVQIKRHYTYIALHKPRGVLSDEGDGTGRVPTVHDLVSVPDRLFPVGRLDLRSEGLILLTDDGDLTHRLTHPRFGHEKEYHTLVEGGPDEATLAKWRRGVFLEGKRTSPAQVNVIEQEEDRTWLRIVLREGRKRQIRRVAAMLGHPARRIIRVRIGPLRLGNLRSRQWRKLSDAEVRALRASVQTPQGKSKRSKKRR
ncbi:MAG: rRNA pseudouridine synthase [Chloroflexi bacterium]|nr:rRNA pseudouridine synthase [Chloroflexota bacterium]